MSHGGLARVSACTQSAVHTPGDIAHLVQHIEVHLPLLFLQNGTPLPQTVLQACLLSLPLLIWVENEPRMRCRKCPNRQIVCLGCSIARFLAVGLLQETKRPRKEFAELPLRCAGPLASDQSLEAIQWTSATS